ncbi:MAG TPA: hypothetical protein VF450_22725 [Noviherbaspirillum sp.]
MASSVNPVSQLVAVIRAQLSAQSNQKAAIQTSARQAQTKARAPEAHTTLETVVQEKIRRIDKRDSERGKKVLRVFLETILLGHFGERLINEPGFHQMVDEIQSAMEADTDIKEAIDCAVKHLLSN